MFSLTLQQVHVDFCFMKLMIFYLIFGYIYEFLFALIEEKIFSSDFIAWLFFT